MTATAGASATVGGTRQRLADDVQHGLSQTPPTLPPRWFYDEHGSRLFDEITRLPEYYPTRRETEILATHKDTIAAVTDATALIELGSGFATKTRLLLDGLTAGGRSLLFVPIDVSAEVMLDAARGIVREYPTCTVEALVADFSDPLPQLPGDPGRRLVAFLGGTIGNFTDDERAAFLDRVRAVMSPGDHFLLGADLVKDVHRLVAAYDDSRGVTAEFNRNVIEVLRRDLDATGLDAEDFEHVARWNAQDSRIEMWLRAVRDVDATFPSIGFSWHLPAGGELLTEISVKFDLHGLRAELEQHELHVIRSWTDDAGDFSLTLARAH